MHHAKHDIVRMRVYVSCRRNNHSEGDWNSFQNKVFEKEIHNISKGKS